VAGGDYICLQTGVPAFGSSPTGAPPFNITNVPDDFHSGYYHYFHATFQREILRNNSVTATYIGSRGKDLVWRKNINSPVLGSPTSGAVDSGGRCSLNPRFRNIFSSRTTASRGAAYSRSGRTSVRRQHAVRNTLSKCIDYNSTNRNLTTAQAMNPRSGE
jgi:hypothetical protein